MPRGILNGSGALSSNPGAGSFNRHHLLDKDARLSFFARTENTGRVGWVIELGHFSSSGIGG